MSPEDVSELEAGGRPAHSTVLAREPVEPLCETHLGSRGAPVRTFGESEVTNRRQRARRRSADGEEPVAIVPIGLDRLLERALE